MAKYPPEDHLAAYLRMQDQLRRAMGDDPLRAFMRQQEQMERAVNASVSAYLQQEKRLSKMVEQIAQPANELARQARLASERAAELAPLLQATYDNTSSLATIGLEYQQRIDDSIRGMAAALYQDDWVYRLHARFEVESVAVLQRNVRLLGRSYRALASDLVSGGSLSRFPAIASLTHFEVFSTADVLAELSFETEPAEAGEQDRISTIQARVNVQEHIDAQLVPALERLHPGLVKVLDGARQARLSKNPDRVRHFVTSNRELFTQVLHVLAPDALVLPWLPAPKSPKDPPLVKDNKPTRRGRILYICRNINQAPFMKFVDRDVAAMVELFELLQKGTHDVDTPFTATQELTLLRRVELAILYLLTIGDTEPQNAPRAPRGARRVHSSDTP